MKNITLCLLLMVLGHLADTSAYSAGKKAPAPESSPVASVLPSPVPSEVPITIDDPHIGFEFVSGTQAERVKLAQAEAKANEVVQGQCFEDFMLHWGLIWTNGKTPAQVVAHLRSTRLTIPIHYYYAKHGPVGYTYPDIKDVYFNRRYHVFYNVCETASNGVHEWAHKPPLSYDHQYKPTSNRGLTVNYGINHAFEKCCK